MTPSLRRGAAALWRLGPVAGTRAAVRAALCVVAAPARRARLRIVPLRARPRDVRQALGGDAVAALRGPALAALPSVADLERRLDAYGEDDRAHGADGRGPLPRRADAVRCCQGGHRPVALSYQRTFGLDTIVVRPFNAYGERQNATAYAGLIPAVIRNVLAGEPVVIDGDGEQTRDMTYVADTVRGSLALAAARKLSGRSYNLGYGTEVSVKAMVAALLAGLECPDHAVVHGPERPGDVRRLLADISAAGDAVGYSPLVSVEDGFARTVRWYVSALPTVAR